MALYVRPCWCNSKEVKHRHYRWLNVTDLPLITKLLPLCNVGTVLFLCSISPGGHDELSSRLWNSFILEGLPDRRHANIVNLLFKGCIVFEENVIVKVGPPASATQMGLQLTTSMVVATKLGWAKKVGSWFSEVLVPPKSFVGVCEFDRKVERHQNTMNSN